MQFSPFLMCFFLPLQEFGNVYPKIETLPFPSGLSPLTQIEVNRLFRVRIVRERGTRHAHRKVSCSCYITRSPTKRTTLVGSLVLIVELGAQRLAAVAAQSYEWANSVYKNALNECALFLSALQVRGRRF